MDKFHTVGSVKQLSKLNNLTQLERIRLENSTIFFIQVSGHLSTRSTPRHSMSPESPTSAHAQGNTRDPTSWISSTLRQCPPSSSCNPDSNEGGIPSSNTSSWITGQEDSCSMVSLPQKNGEISRELASPSSKKPSAGWRRSWIRIWIS